MTENAVKDVVDGFGDEWSRFDQSALSSTELEEISQDYFSIFPWDKIGKNSVGFDLGCGTGRWAKIVAPRVGVLHLIDASDKALAVAKRNLRGAENCQFHLASVDAIPLADNSCDFGYSLGVLHHIPDTQAGLEACVDKLKSGAPFLLYLYYRFDNRPAWFRAVWRSSEIVRNVVARLPHSARYAASQILAASVYFPLARTAKGLEKIGMNVENLPLSQYRNRRFYVMRNDALDRFGTQLEQRFTKAEMREMMEKAGLENITFGEKAFWTAVGFKK
jgi:ubiquinone/menaquinone biosynthesis C-methylase UbiE